MVDTEILKHSIAGAQPQNKDMTRSAGPRSIRSASSSVGALSIGGITLILSLVMVEVQTVSHWALAGATMVTVYALSSFRSFIAQDMHRFLSVQGFPGLLFSFSVLSPVIAMTLTDIRFPILQPNDASTLVAPLGWLMFGYSIASWLPAGPIRAAPLFVPPPSPTTTEAGLASIAGATLAIAWFTQRGSAYGYDQLRSGLLESAASFSQLILLLTVCKFVPNLLKRGNARKSTTEKAVIFSLTVGTASSALGGSRTLVFAISIAFLLGLALTWSGEIRRVSIRQMVRALGLLLAGVIALSVVSASVRTLRSNSPLSEALRVPLAETLIGPFSTGLWITAQTVSLQTEGDSVGVTLLVADVATALPVGIDRLVLPMVGSKSAALSFRDAIGFDNPNSGLGMSLVGEFVWIAGSLGSFVLGCAVSMAVRWSVGLSRRLLVMTIGLAMVSQLPYIVRSDAVVPASMIFGGLLWALLIRIGDRISKARD